MALFVGPYLFIVFYPTLSGTTPNHAISMLHASFWNPLFQRVLFVLTIIIAAVGYLFRHRKVKPDVSAAQRGIPN